MTAANETAPTGPTQLPVARKGCHDLDPNWPGIDGKPRGPTLCVSYPDCECGREDAALANPKATR